MSSKVAGKKRAQPTESDNEAEMEGDHQLSIAGDGSESGVKDKVGSSSSSKTEPQSKTTSKSKSGSGSKSKTKKRKQAPSPGIVYISRLPPGMTPQKVKHLMGRWGDVGKIYAQKKDAPTGYNPDSAKQKKKEKHAAANYSEAWVEFLDKGVAKTVAKMLNAQVIGGKKGDKWSDDIWTMKYLSGFKWEMLGEQVAYERQAHQARLRNEITQSRAVQGEYLRNVELARVLEKRRAKKAEQEGQIGTSGDTKAGKTGSEIKLGKGSSGDGGDGKDKEGMKGRYRQREAVDRASGLEKKGMDSVLGSVFG